MATLRPGDIRVTTSIPRKIYTEAKERGITIKSLVFNGWNWQFKQPQLIARIRFLEQEVERMKMHIDRLTQASYSGGLRLKR